MYATFLGWFSLSRRSPNQEITTVCLLEMFWMRLPEMLQRQQ
jgi:hypothetical protein